MTNMQDKICLVTGATDGIGKVTALELARMGASIVIIARDEIKAQQVVEDIITKTNNGGVSYLIADLSSLADIRSVAERFKQQHDELHVLVNNAAQFTASRRETIDGYEMQFAVNHLAYFLLTNYLLDTLKATGTSESKSRIVNVTSKMHVSAKLNFDDLHNTQGYKGLRTYAESKLANIMFTYELARRLEQETANITVNAVHPGFVISGLAKDPNSLQGWLLRLGMFLIRWKQMPPEKGARTSLYVATSPEVEGITGQYFEKSKVVPSSDASLVETDWLRLWEISKKLTALK
jgi:NAD(P)-dependent dehydrogenase (short-subunit alcohol dehydrogenase family)